MTIQTIDDKLKDIIAEHLGVDRENVTDDATFEQLGGDSLDKIEIIMACEEAFEIEIPDGDADGLTTVGQAVEYVTAKVGAR